MHVVMVSLLGEQPIPNLIPIRFYQPDVALLVYTTRTQTVHRRLEGLIQSRLRSCQVDPYDISSIFIEVDGVVAQEKSAGVDFLFNLTGGTKAMMLAGYRLAQSYGSPFLYLQTEGG